jgi:hypothetical protein
MPDSSPEPRILFQQVLKYMNSLKAICGLNHLYNKI